MATLHGPSGRKITERIVELALEHHGKQLGEAIGEAVGEVYDGSGDDREMLWTLATLAIADHQPTPELGRGGMRRIIRLSTFKTSLVEKLSELVQRLAGEAPEQKVLELFELLGVRRSEE